MANSKPNNGDGYFFAAVVRANVKKGLTLAQSYRQAAYAWPADHKSFVETGGARVGAMKFFRPPVPKPKPQVQAVKMELMDQTQLLKEAPLGALNFRSPESDSVLLSESGGVEKFRLVGNSGRPFKHWWFGETIIDFENLRLRSVPLNVLREHDPLLIAGRGTRVENDLRLCNKINDTVLF